MSFGQKNVDKEWPTFNYEDVQVSYSPNDGENENDNIFTEFKPATEFHNIRNKKRKSKKARALRLISESEINRKKQSCCQDRKRCVVISVLVICIIIIIAICIFLGIYFGVILKGKSSSSKAQSGSSVEVVTLSSTKIPPPTTATSKKTTTTQPRPTIPPTSKPPPLKTTSSSTTTSSTASTTTTSTTTTTTTTTTTPMPTTTEPPVRHFTGSEDEIDEVIATAENCTSEIIFTTDGINQDKKCSLYFEMLRCVYVLSTKNLLHVPVHILGEIMENKTRDVFPIWIEIDPFQCKVSGILDIGNVTVLPLKLSELCSSPDAIMYYGKRDCHLVEQPDILTQESDVNKCRIRWGTIECISYTMSCQHEEIESAINLYESDVTDVLHTANKLLCNDMYESMLQSSPCSMILYRYMGSIYKKCSNVIRQGSLLYVPDLACPLFEVFFECSYTHIPSLMRYETCERKKNELRSVTFDIAQTLSKVDSRPIFFIDVSSCIDTPIVSNYICEAPKKLITVVDSLCYVRFKFITQATICKVISEYIYKCGPQFIEDLDLKCTASQIKAAMVSESSLLFQKYGFNMTNLANQDKCIDSADSTDDPS